MALIRGDNYQLKTVQLKAIHSLRQHGPDPTVLSHKTLSKRNINKHQKRLLNLSASTAFIIMRDSLSGQACLIMKL